jgi:hypothetical protein
MSEVNATPRVGRMTAEKLAAQGGKRKERGFWKSASTVAILKNLAEGEITMEQAARELQTTPAAVVWALRERGFTQSRAKQAAAKRADEKESPIPHGTASEDEADGDEVSDDEVPF